MAVAVLQGCGVVEEVDPFDAVGVHDVRTAAAPGVDWIWRLRDCQTRIAARQDGASSLAEVRRGRAGVRIGGGHGCTAVLEPGLILVTSGMGNGWTAS